MVGSIRDHVLDNEKKGDVCSVVYIIPNQAEYGSDVWHCRLQLLGDINACLVTKSTC